MKSSFSKYQVLKWTVLSVYTSDWSEQFFQYTVYQVLKWKVQFWLKTLRKQRNWNLQSSSGSFNFKLPVAFRSRPCASKQKFEVLDGGHCNVLLVVDILDSNQRTGRCGGAGESRASAGELQFLINLHFDVINYINDAQQRVTSFVYHMRPNNRNWRKPLKWHEAWLLQRDRATRYVGRNRAYTAQL